MSDIEYISIDKFIDIIKRTDRKDARELLSNIKNIGKSNDTVIDISNHSIYCDNIGQNKFDSYNLI